MLSPSKCKKAQTSKQAATASRGSSNQLGALKLQKGAKPLAGKQFFLDVRNHSTSSRLETSIKGYGGVVNPFIGRNIDCVVTDRAEWGGTVPSAASGSPLCAGGTPKPSPSPLPPLFSPAASPAGNSRGSNFSPSTLDSPGESYGGGRRHPKSRAEAMLERVRSQPQFRTRDPLADAQSWGLCIFSVEKFLKFLFKISQSLKKSDSDIQIIPPRRKSEPTCSKVKTRTGKYFIKIESIDRNYRPSYKDLPCWPSLNFDSEPGSSPFVLKPVASATVVSQPKAETLGTKEPLVSKHGVTVPPNKGQKPLRRSPRKRQSPQKQNSPLKRNAKASNPSQKHSNFVFQDRESVSLVPPRPPSKRHPERSLFPETKKEEELFEPLPGYCEICKVDYKDLRKHCQTDAHRQYSTDHRNYAQLDERINTQSVTVEAFLKSLLPLNTSRNSKPEEAEPCNLSACEATPDGSNMRQPVDDRHTSSKMVGRKETLEVQCNGISNHVQTRFTCTKGDRENIGGIFLDERLTAAQLRKRRSISVSCKDLLEITPASERTHYLRSARPARSELSQLSPALSDNSHPLLNSNSHQPLLSPTLSERGHNLRTRSQLWSNVIDEDPLVVTANSHPEKAKPDKSSDKIEKPDKGDKLEKNDKSGLHEEVLDVDGEDSKEKGQKDIRDVELRPPRNHCRNKSIRRKRLSAEEKLIEDNRGYYKVEVLNSKLRSTGFFVQQSAQGGPPVNGACTSNGPGRSGSQEEKEPVVVRFKKVRRSELSVLSDEAENFMFGEQRSESNSENLSDSDEDDDDGEEEEDDEDEDGDGEDDNDESGGTDSNGINENGTDSSRSRSSQRNGRRSGGSNRQRRNQALRFKIRVGNDNAYSRCASGDSGNSTHNNGLEANCTRRSRKRRTQVGAFLTDNADYFQFELSGPRLRIHSSPSSRFEMEESSSPEKSKLPTIEEPVVREVIDGTPCPIDDLHFSFESVPRSEVWFQTFQRQDRGDELCFPCISEPSTVILPYQLPRVNNNGQRSLGRRRCKSSVRLPRKSPRCHASTLAILSSVVKRRSSKDPEKVISADSAPVADESAEVEQISTTKSQPSSSSTEQQAAASSKDDCVGAEEEVQEIARNIDSMLGLVPGSSSELERDQDSSQQKSQGKGRGRKKQAAKPVIASVGSGSDTVPESDREKDPSLNYLVDPAILEELACTCDVVSDPRGGPTMDILSLLSSYSDCCCTADEPSSADHGVDASCNSSECGASSTCDAERRMRKKRKRRNMTGWDKPKRRCILRRDVHSGPEESICVKDVSSKEDVLAESEPMVNSTDNSESSVHKVPNSISSSPAFQRKRGNKRKLRSSLSQAESPCKGNVPGQTRLNVMKIEKDGEVSVPAKKGKSRKVRRIGWSKAR